MPAILAGEAAVRIVPSLKGFKTEADRRLRAYKFEPISVNVNPDLAKANAEMAKWRALQERNALNINVKTDTKQLLRELSTVEHIFKRSSLSRAIRLNVKVIGLDALPALAFAAGSATSGLDALGKSAFLLPGLIGGALASVGALAVGLSGVGNALKAYSTDLANSAQHTKTIDQDNRQVARSYRNYKDAVRETTREIQDLNAENRRSSLNVADAVLSVQEAADKLREGGQKSVLQLRRDQLSYLQSIDHLQEIQTKAQRTAQDAQQANADGVQGADKVANALDQIAKNTEKLNVDKVTAVDKALAKLAPSARLTVEAIHNLRPAWLELQNSVQGKLFQGMDKEITDLGQKALPGLQVGLTRVAGGLNTNFKAIFASVGSDKNRSLLDRIFGNTDGGLQKLSGAMDPLISGIMRLTKEGTDFLPRLGIAADKVFTRFDNFIARISDDGSLDKWIDQGLNSLSSIGNIAINIGSVIDKVAESFNAASGTQGGFLTTLENATGPNSKLMQFLNSGKLVDYFRQANEFIGHIGQAIKDMQPFFGTIVDTAREWSGYIFSVASGFFQAADAIQRNTQLLAPMIGLYLTIRTFRPVVEGLTGAWKIYASTIEKLARSESLGGMFGPAARNLDSLKNNSKTATDVAAGGFRTLGSNVDSTTTKVTSLIDELNRLNKAVQTGQTGKFDPTGAARSSDNIAAQGSAVSRTRALDAGIGLSDTPLQDRLAAGNAAYVQRLALRNADLLAARNEEMFRAFDSMTGADAARGAAGMTGSAPLRRRTLRPDRSSELDQSVPGMGALQGPMRPEPSKDNIVRSRNTSAEVRRAENRAALQRANASYLADSYKFYDPDRKFSGGGRAAPALGAIQGPELPPGFGTTKSPALGKMEGPQLTPEFLRQLSAASDEATPKLQSVGDVADKTAANVATAGDSSKTAAPKVDALGEAAKTATPKVTTATTAAKDFGTAAGNTVTPLTNAGDSAKTAAGKITTAGDEASTAADKMAGSGKLSLLSGAKALATGLLPGALLFGAVIGISAAITKLGEAHKRAAESAKAQDDAEAALAQTLDSTTGSFTAATLQQTIDTLSKTKIGGINGDQPININDVLTRLGMDPRVAGTNAADPSAAAANQVQQDNLDEQVRQQVEASPLYQKNKGQFDEYGLDSLTLAKAAQGDPTALAKVNDAKNNPHTTTNERGAAEAIRIPDLTALALSLPNQDAFQAGFALRGINQTNVPTGQSALTNSQIAAGHPTFTPGGANFFKDLQPDVPSLTKDVTGSGVIQINAPVPQATVDYWKNDLGFDVSNPIPPSNKRTVKIPAEKVDGYLTAPKYAYGGLIRGSGGPRDDNHLIKASAGEHITQQPAVKYYGQKLFDDLNGMRIPKRGWGGMLGGGFKLDPVMPSIPAPPPGLGSMFAPPSVSAPPPSGLPGPLAQLPSPTPPASSPANLPPGPNPNLGQTLNPDGTVKWNNFPTPSPLAPPALTPPPTTPTTPGNAPTGLPGGPVPAAPTTPALPAEVGYTGPTALTNGLPSIGTFQSTPYGLPAGTEIGSGGKGFPDWVYQLGARFGVSPGTYAGHQEGSGFNRGIDWTGSPENMRAFAEYAKTAPGLEQVIFQDPRDGSKIGRDPGDRGANQSIEDYYRDDWAGHTDHVHTRQSSSIPTPEELATLLPGGVPSDFLTNGTGGGGFLDSLQRLFTGGVGSGGGGQKARTPEDGAKFLKDTLISTAGQAGNIALQAFGSFFGLDLSYLDAAKQVGNFYLGELGKGQGQNGDTPATDQALGLLQTYQSGAPYAGGNGPMDQGNNGFANTNNPGSGTAGWGFGSSSALSAPGKKGGEAYRQLVRQIVRSQGPKLKIPPSAYKIWEDALVKQIDTESGGDPFSQNNNDSDGKGGTQSVQGLFNFLPSTFSSVNHLGGSINDPASQIAAAMALVANKGLGKDGGPAEYGGTIGKGHGFYADGGSPFPGAAMVSAGEYRTNPAAVAHYGPGLYQMLNSMSLPKSAIRGFAGGGFPGPASGTASSGGGPGFWGQLWGGTKVAAGQIASAFNAFDTVGGRVEPPPNAEYLGVGGGGLKGILAEVANYGTATGLKRAVPKSIDSIAPPLNNARLTNSTNMSWQSPDTFDAYKQLMRDGATDAFTNGYKGIGNDAVPGIVGPLARHMPDVSDPAVQAALRTQGSELAASANAARQTNLPFRRGLRMTPDELAALKPGGSMSMPLSSFSDSQEVAMGFALRDPRFADIFGDQALHTADDSLPVMFELMAGAKGAAVGTDFRETLFGGAFDISKIAPGIDGLTKIRLSQRALTEDPSAFMGNILPLMAGKKAGGLIQGPGTGISDSIPLRASHGEYMVRADAVKKYGTGFLDRVNAGHFAYGGFPLGAVINPPDQQGQTPGPLPLARPPDAQQMAPPAIGPSAPGATRANGGNGSSAAPSTGGPPGPGATAPAPDPGVLPSVRDTLTNIGAGIGAGPGNAQPGANPGTGFDPRATLGAAPASGDHLNPALKAGIKSGFAHAGAIGASIASGAGGFGLPGVGTLIQGGADVAGSFATGVANIFSSLLVGTATGGSTANASGVPMLPQRPPVQTGVPPLQRIHNGDINVTNLDEYKRAQSTIEAQQTMPFIGKY